MPKTSGIIQNFSEWQQIVNQNYPCNYPAMSDPIAEDFLVKNLKIKGFMVRPLIIFDDQVVLAQQFETISIWRLIEESLNYEWLLHRVQFFPTRLEYDLSEQKPHFTSNGPKWIIKAIRFPLNSEMA